MKHFASTVDTSVDGTSSPVVSKMQATVTVNSPVMNGVLKLLCKQLINQQEVRRL